MLVPPNANRRPRFDMELLQNVFHMFLHGAAAASENLSDLAVTFTGSDPFRDFELALGERTGPRGIRGDAFVDLR
jgi:hypothetical protein